MTIYDIAKEAGVSASTVSRVINNRPGVNKETRERVRALLAQHHYVPNEAARGLVTNSSRLVGVLVADLRNHHHIEGAYYIADELRRMGYCALVLNTGDSDEERVEGIRMLEKRKVEAAVLMGSIFQTDSVKQAIAGSLANVPVFMLNGCIDLPNVYGVLVDDCEGTAACVRLLAQKGKCHIAYVVDQLTPSNRLKLAGYERAIAELPDAERIVVEGTPSSCAGGEEAVRRLLAAHPETDGIVCSVDVVACGALHALQAAGRRVPQDVAVIGTDNSIYCDICTPKLTSLNTMILESSVMIAHELADSLEGRGTNRKTLIFTGIVEREST